jgi:hypothetical protein
MWRRALLLAAALVGVSRLAHANGRFPEAGQLVVDPASPSHLVARTTYGLIASTDAGATWSWVCEDAVQYAGAFDPAIAVTPGATLAAIPGGVSRSVDRGCAWSIAPGPLSGALVIDLAVDRSANRHVVGLTLPADVTPGTQATFAESLDDGATWSVPGALLPEDFRPVTVDVAPSRPQRVYASGNGAFPQTGIFVRSDDGGKTWEQLSFDMRGGRVPFVAAVDPSDPDVVWLRMKADDGDRLWVSVARGIGWREVFVATGSLLGFALSPDGATVAVGVPGDGVWTASVSSLLSDGGAGAFARTSTLDVRCLTWADAGLYACANEPNAGFSIGLSTDRGGTFAPLYRTRALSPLSCAPKTSAGDACASVWPGVQATLQRGGDAGVDAAASPLDGGSVDLATAPGSQKRACICNAFDVPGSSSRAAWCGALAWAAAFVVRRRTRPLRSRTRR